MFELSYLSWILMGLIIWACSYVSWRTYQKEEVTTLYDLSVFLLHFGLFFVIMGLPGALPGEFSADQLGAFYIFGHIFLYSGFAYYSKIPVRILKPAWTNRVFAANLLLGAALTLLNLTMWPQPEIHASGITILNIAAPVGAMIGVLAFFNWILGAVLFFGWRAMKKHGEGRQKFLLMSMAFLLLSIAGPMHDNTTSLEMLLASDAATFVGVILLMADIFYRRSPPTDIPDYNKAIKEIIRKNREITGEVAFSIASELEFIDIKDGEVEVKCEARESEVLELIDRYREIQDVSINGIARQALQGIVESHHYTELPPEILPTRVKERQLLGL